MVRKCTSLVFALASSSVALLLAVACGGGSPQGHDAKDPSSTANGAPAGSGPAASGGGDTTAPATGGATTTTQLGSGGDLQGAKLGSATRKEIETKGDGGPRTSPGGKSDEPGRRAEDIRTAVAARRDEARACYDKALTSHPGLEGDLDIKWVIDPQGKVSDVAIDHQKSSIHEDTLGTCIGDVIKKISFAPSQKGFETRAHYPFNFHPKNAPVGKDAGK